MTKSLDATLENKTTNHSMQIDLIGRVKSTKLAHSNALLPLFEAIINSIHSIEDKKEQKGIIDIFIERDNSQLTSELDNGEPYFAPIVSFAITDNGVGFNEVNYSSFQKAHSTLKEDRGSKGIGRFLWLKAFDKVNIQSFYVEDGKGSKREFDFLLNNYGIANYKHSEDNSNQYKTTVKLQKFKVDYQKECPKKSKTIADKIIEHCLFYFLQPNCPTINLHNEEDPILVLNEIFAQTLKSNQIVEKFKVDNFDFELTLIRLYNHDEIKQHKVHLCANNREVDNFNTSEIIPDLKLKIEDEGNADKSYFLIAYVSGKYFDDNVNDERTEIKFVKEGKIKYDFITQNDLHNAIAEKIKSHIKVPLQKIKEEKAVLIKTFIDAKAPQYRTLLKYPEALDEIQYNVNSSEEDLDLKLYKVYQKIEFRVKKDAAFILNADKIDDARNLPDYKEKYTKFIEEVNDMGKSKLAQYIIHRKLILDLFSKTLDVQDDGKYSLENSVHDIIFPLKSTSDDVDYEKQNLWIIDEKLSYHSYLASDKALSKIPGIDINSKVRPDLVIFNNPYAFVEGATPFSSVVIVEFKRPLRNDYAEDDNPISQVYGYIRNIRDGKKTNKTGRPFEIPENTPFYSYVICDITPKLITEAENLGLDKTPDGSGYFGYNKNLKTYIEVISYNKLLDNANKRNRVLFDKLGLPFNY